MYSTHVQLTCDSFVAISENLISFINQGVLEKLSTHSTAVLDGIMKYELCVNLVENRNLN